MCLAAYLGIVRTSGVVGIDDKWILVCSPSAIHPHGRRARAIWRYVYFAVDVYSYDLLALEFYPDHNDDAVRLILLALKAKGIRPRVVVSDLDPAYGRMLPLVFPNAIHHECIFHALQFWSSQMTKVYGRYYREKVPEAVPLHDALANLFNAQTQKTIRKRYAALMALREAYVTKTPALATIFDSVERHFPKLVNAIENPDIPRTNNATELVIRRFDQHYQAMCGFESLASAEKYLRVFELVYRLTPFTDDARPEIRGKSPLELAGYDLKSLPIANFFMYLKLPSLALQGTEVVPIK
jgi:transposase-like protein